MELGDSRPTTRPPRDTQRWSQAVASKISGRITRLLVPHAAAIQSAVKTMDLTKPDTALSRIEHRYVPLFESLVESARSSVLARLFVRWIATKSGARFMERRVLKTLRSRRVEARADPRGRALLRLIRSADKRTPFASSIAFLELMRDREMYRKEFAAIAQIAGLGRLRGERRARAAADAIQSLSETRYKQYLRFVHRLVFLTEGRQPSVPPTVGALVAQILSKVPDHAEVVHAELIWLRNAIAHRDFRYDPAADCLVFTPPDRPVTALSGEALVALARDMATLAHETAGRVGTLYYYRDLVLRSGLGSVLLSVLPRVVSKDEEACARAGDELFAHVERTFQPFFDLERAAPEFPMFARAKSSTTA